MRLFQIPRAATAASLALALLFPATPVFAQEVPGPAQPEIVRAPSTIGFGGTAEIRGRLERGTPGDTVILQLTRPGQAWRDVASRPVNDNLRVMFKRRLVRTTAFRLVHRDDVSGVAAASDRHRVRVRSLLRSEFSPRHVYVGSRVSVKGRLQPASLGRRVVLQQRVDGGWTSIKKLEVRSGGYFSGRFKARQHGYRRTRVVFRGDGASLRATSGAAVRVYKRELATWYGPGFFGNRTACGRTLTTSTLGVAHRTLPCGTSVSILHNGRSITVKVIDRGPFTNARWDLTQETARRVGFSGKETIGVTH